MNITEKYLTALKQIDGWTQVSEWAVKVGELYPDLLVKAEREAANQANDTTGLREIAARISSSISRGAYAGKIEINDAERPRLIRYLPENELEQHISHDIDEDIAPLKRGDIIKEALEKLGTHELYRLTEFEAISKNLKQFFSLDFEVDHAQALLNSKEPGKHHPDNFQLILKAHNAKKNNDNCLRFNFAEQADYIKTAIKLQTLVSAQMNIDMNGDVLDSLLSRLEKVY